MAIDLGKSHPSLYKIVCLLYGWKLAAALLEVAYSLLAKGQGQGRAVQVLPLLAQQPTCKLPAPQHRGRFQKALKMLFLSSLFHLKTARARDLPAPMPVPAAVVPLMREATAWLQWDIHRAEHGPKPD